MEETKDLLDNIRRSVGPTPKGDTSGLTNPLPLPNTTSKPSFEKFSDDRPEMRYKTLNSGMKVSMYDSYVPGTDNNERLAQNQSGWDQTINGLTKAFSNTNSVIVGNTAGFVYGLADWARTGNFNSVFDNSFSRTLDDWNTKLNYELPNYYTKDQQNAGFFGSLGTANFWANDVANGISFTLGTIASEAIWAAATGGASIPARMGMWGAKVGQMGRLLKGAGTAARIGEEAVGAGRFGKALLGTEKVAEGLANYKGFVYQALDNAVTSGKLSKGLANTLAKTGEVLNTTRFIGTSSGNEAGIEAFHFKKEAIENFYHNFEELNGRPPTAEESAEMMDKIEGAANNVFASNMAILGVSNLAMLGGLFNIKSPISSMSKAVNQKLFGIGVEQSAGLGGDLVFKGIERKAWQKGAGYLYKGVSPVFREGMFEEGLQGATTKTANNWIERQYDPKYLNQLATFSDDAWKAMQEQYGTKEGWKEIGIGGIVGLIGGIRVAGKGITHEMAGFDEQAKFQEEVVSKSLNAANVTMKTFVADINAGRMMTMAKVMDSQDRAQQAMTKRDVVEAKLAQNESMIAIAEMYDNPLYGAGGLAQMERHGNNMIDTTEVSEEEKEELKKGFKDFVKSYQSAKTFANSIIGTQGKLYGSKFEAADVNKALTYTILQGESSKKMMDTSLDDFSALMGKDHADTIRRNDELQALDSETRGRFNELSQEHKKLESRSEALQQKIQLEQISTKEGRESQLPALQREVLELEKRKQEVNNEIEKIADKISVNKKLSKTFEEGIEGAPMTDEFISVKDLLDVENNINKLEDAYKTLESINPISAKAAKEYIDNYKKAQKALLNHNTAIKLIASGKFKPGLKSGNPFSKMYQKFAKGEYKGDEHTLEFLKTLEGIRESFNHEVRQELQEEDIAKSKRILADLDKVEGELTAEQLKDKAEAEDILKGLRDEEFLNSKREALEKEFSETEDEERRAAIDTELKELENILNPKDDTPTAEGKTSQEIQDIKDQISQLEEELKNLPTEQSTTDTKSSTSSPIINTPSADIIAELNKFSTFQEKLEWLKNNNYLQPIVIAGKEYNAIDYSDRVMVMVKIGSVNMPFYISTGKAGKKSVKAGNWYAVFGIGHMSDSDKRFWINKGTEADINIQYGSVIFQKIAKILNEGVGNIESREDNGNGKIKEGIGFLEDVQSDIDSFNSQIGVPNYVPANNNQPDVLRENIKKIGEAINSSIGSNTAQPNPRIKEIQDEIESFASEDKIKEWVDSNQNLIETSRKIDRGDTEEQFPIILDIYTGEPNRLIVNIGYQQLSKDTLRSTTGHGIARKGHKDQVKALLSILSTGKLIGDEAPLTDAREQNKHLVNAYSDGDFMLIAKPGKTLKNSSGQLQEFSVVLNGRSIYLYDKLKEAYPNINFIKANELTEEKLSEGGKYDAKLEVKKESPNPRIKEIQDEIKKLKKRLGNLTPKSSLSTVEQLEARIKDILSLFKTSFVGTQDVDEAVKNKPDQKDIDKYNELKGNAIIKNFDMQDNFDTSLISEKDRNTISEYLELKEKLSQWRIYDNLAEGDESLADLLDILSQLREEVEQQDTVDAPNIEDVFQGEEKAFGKTFVADLSINTNYPVTVKKLPGGNFEITHMRPSTLLIKMGAEEIKVKGKKAEISIDEVNDLKPGTIVNFKSGGVERTITIEERSRISLSKKNFESIPGVKTITSLTNWSFPTVYEQDEEGNWKPIPSDFSDSNITGDTNDLDAEDIVELYVDTENEHNKKLLAMKLTPQELANQVVIYIRKNGKNFGTIKGLTKAIREGGKIAADSIGIVTLRDTAGEVLSSGASGTIATTKVKYVQMGNPILNLDKSGEVEQREITDKGLENIVATGFIQDGEITLNGKVDSKKVRRSFLKKLSEKNKGKKIPFVVIKRGKQMIAFPIKLNKTSAPKTEELYKILYDTEKTDAQKTSAINNLLLANGIAPKDYNLTNLDEEVIADIEKALEANEEFITAEQLTDKSYKLENLKKDATIALDLEKIELSLPSQKVNINLANIEYEDRPEPKNTPKGPETPPSKGKGSTGGKKKTSSSTSKTSPKSEETSTETVGATEVKKVRNPHTIEFYIDDVQLRKLPKRLANKIKAQTGTLKVIPFTEASIIALQNAGVSTAERNIKERNVTAVEFEVFQKTGEVDEQVLEGLTNKIKSGKDLSQEEIIIANAKEIEIIEKVTTKKESKVADSEEIANSNFEAKSFEESTEDLQPAEEMTDEAILKEIARKIYKSKLNVAEYVDILEDEEEKAIILADIGVVEKEVKKLAPVVEYTPSTPSTKPKTESLFNGPKKEIDIEGLPIFIEEDYAGKSVTWYKLDGFWGTIEKDKNGNDYFDKLFARAQPIMEAKYQAKLEIPKSENSEEC